MLIFDTNVNADFHSTFVSSSADLTTASSAFSDAFVAWIRGHPEPWRAQSHAAPVTTATPEDAVTGGGQSGTMR